MEKKENLEIYSKSLNSLLQSGIALPHTVHVLNAQTQWI